MQRPLLLLLLPLSAWSQPVDFARDIQPIFARSCNSCHGAAAMGGLRLDAKTLAAKSIRAGQATASSLYQRVAGIGEQARMPMGDPQQDTAQLRDAVAGLMESIPGLRPAPGESDAAFGKLTLSDGRTLAYMDRGPRTGTPVLHFHGFQGSRLERMAADDGLLAKLNIRLISPDRPGIGLSTPARDRTVAGWAADVRQLAGHLLGPGQPFSILGFPPAQRTRWPAGNSLDCGPCRWLAAWGCPI